MAPRSAAKQRIAVGVLLVLGCAIGCSSNLPPVVAAPPLPAAHGIRILLYQEPTARYGQPFGEALAKALADAGFMVVEEERPQAFDFVITYEKDANFSARPHAWNVRFGLSARGLDDERWRGNSWEARFAAVRDGEIGRGAMARGESGGNDNLLAPMERCFAEWKAGSKDYGDTLGTMNAVRNGIGVWGPGDSNAAPDTDTRAAIFLVNHITSCPGVAELLDSIKVSGVGAASRMEDLPADRLMTLCKRSSRYSHKELAVGTGAVRSLRDACAIAARKDPRLAPAVAALLRDEETAVQAQVEYNRTNFGGCTEMRPIRCGSGANTWCCTNELPVCGGCGSNCCPTPQVVIVRVPGAPTPDPGAPSPAFAPPAGRGSPPPASQASRPTAPPAGPAPPPSASCSCQGFVCKGVPVAGCSVSHPGARCDCGYCASSAIINSCH